MRRIFRRIVSNTIFWHFVPKSERLIDSINGFEQEVECVKHDIQQLELDIAADQLYLTGLKGYLALIEKTLDTLELEAQ